VATPCPEPTDEAPRHPLWGLLKLTVEAEVTRREDTTDPKENV
jgi:hypothetical protein